jgi:hypothetical protein
VLYWLCEGRASIQTYLEAVDKDQQKCLAHFESQELCKGHYETGARYIERCNQKLNTNVRDAMRAEAVPYVISSRAI